MLNRFNFNSVHVPLVPLKVDRFVQDQKPSLGYGHYHCATSPLLRCNGSVAIVLTSLLGYHPLNHGWTIRCHCQASAGVSLGSLRRRVLWRPPVVSCCHIFTYLSDFRWLFGRWEDNWWCKVSRVSFCCSHPAVLIDMAAMLFPTDFPHTRQFDTSNGVKFQQWSSSVTIGSHRVSSIHFVSTIRLCCALISITTINYKYLF